MINNESNFFMSEFFKDFSFLILRKGEHPMLHEVQWWFTKLLKKMKESLLDCYPLQNENLNWFC